MNPQIPALYELQKRDRQLTRLERKLELIPARIKELDDDLAKLEAMLEGERRKSEETRAFQRSQEMQLTEEEELLRNSRARLQQVKNARELNATQREIDQTKRMAATRAEEIQKLKSGVEQAEERIAAMSSDLEALRTQADAEKARLAESRAKLEGKLGRLRSGRTNLTDQIDKDMLRTYDRIRRRLGGMAFVPASDGRCTACKMVVPHQTYVQLRKGEDLMSCESCGRMLYWGGHFKKEEEEAAKNKGPKPKASPPQKRVVPKDE